MTIAHEFSYFKPRSLKEAVKALARYGHRGQVLAGGTDLIGLIADEVLKPEILIDIKGIAELKLIELKNDVLHIGALITFADLLESAVVAKKFPVIAEMAGWVASSGIRNRATLVGNVCSAVPCCDSGPILLVYGAVLQVAGPRGRRKIPVAEWFVAPRKTSLKKGEIVTGASIPLPKKEYAACFVKLGRYRGEDLAQASVTVLACEGNNYRIAFGSVAPRPIRGRRAEALLAGKPLSPELIAEAVELVRDEIAPITDIRASKEYRAHMVGVMLERGLQTAVSRLKGEGPEYGTSVI